MLTASQSKTYQFIQQYIRKNSYSPTMAEIAKGIGIRSRGVVHRYVHDLVAKGLVQVMPNRRRNIQLLVRTSSKWVLPLMGKMTAQGQIETASEGENIDIAETLLGSGRFALIVKDNSMIEEGIYCNDVIICERLNTVSNGKIVLALIDDKYMTLKKLHCNVDETITLLPIYSTHQPLIYDNHRIKIQGIFIGLVRTNM